MAKTPKRPVKPEPDPEPARDNPWPKRLKDLRDRLGLQNHEIAGRLRISTRLWMSWIYGERKPSPSSQLLLNDFIAQNKKR